MPVIKKSVNLCYEINTSAVTVLGSWNNIFLDIYAYMTLEQNKSKKEGTKQFTTNNKR